MDECIEQLKKVEKMSAKEVSRLTPSSGWLSFLPGSKLSRPSADLAHVQVINAEAQLIIATMRLLKESLMEKGGHFSYDYLPLAPTPTLTHVPHVHQTSHAQILPAHASIEFSA